MPTVKHLSPPRNKGARLRPKGAKLTAREETSEFLSRFGAFLVPFVFSLWVALIALITGPWPDALGYPMWLAQCCVFGVWSAWVLVFGHRIGASRRIEKGYAIGTVFLGLVWLRLATTLGAEVPHRPALRELVTLALGTLVASIPWWLHRRTRNSIKVVFEDGVSRLDRGALLRETRSLINDWTGFTSAGHLQGARLRGLTFTVWSVIIHVRLRRGAAVREFTELRLAKLESACPWDVRPGSARVERDKTNASHASIRFMLEDPHAETITPPDDERFDVKNIVIGLFETGEKIFFDLVNTIIAGALGSGKSGIINTLIRFFARIPVVALVGIDMKPGAPEFGPWREVFAFLADTPARAEYALTKLIEAVERRGLIMAERHWRKWKATRAEPHIVLIIDEVQLLEGPLRKLLVKLSGITRAYGIWIIVATQHPKDTNLPSTILNNCPQRVGTRLGSQVADRLVFGEDAGKTGFLTTRLCPTDREGSLLIRNTRHKEPILGRAYYLDDDDVERECEMLAPFRTDIDQGSWPTHESAPTGPAAPGELIPGNGRSPTEYVDAEVIRLSPEEQIFEAIKLGYDTPAKISEFTGIPVRTVKAKIKALADAGMIGQAAPRAPWVIVEGTGADSPALTP